MLKRWLLSTILLTSLCGQGFAWKDDSLYNIDGVLKVDGSGYTQTVSGTVTATSSLGATGTASSVNDTASSTTLLASNASRRQASIVNDSTVVLYVLLGSGTASATNYTYRLDQYDSLIVNSYSGRINGIWASDASGAAKVTEVT